MSEHSQKRVESRIREAVGMLIVSGEIKNPLLNTLVSVTRVTVSKDNAYATVYLSAPIDDQALEKSIDALTKAAGFIQKRVGDFLGTRNTPRLTFKADAAVRDGDEVNALLDSLRQEREKAGDGE